MNRLTFVFLLLVSLSAQAQNSTKLKSIITLKGKDTFEIKTYDEQQHLIFEKHYPQYGISQILTYTYEGHTLTHSVWSHSSVGFLISDYTYDTEAHTRKAYSYEFKGNINNLMSYSNLEQLKQSPEYLEAYQKEKGFLKEIVYYNDTLINRKIQYTETGDTLDVEEYSYKNKLVSSVKQNFHHRKAFNEIVYHYDIHGNEIAWMKIFAGTDTATVYKKKYHHHQLIEEQGFSKYMLESTTRYTYSGDRLMSKKEYDAQHMLKIDSRYLYDKSKRLATVNTANGYRNLHTVAYYYYY